MNFTKLTLNSNTRFANDIVFSRTQKQVGFTKLVESYTGVQDLTPSTFAYFISPPLLCLVDQNDQFIILVMDSKIIQTVIPFGTTKVRKIQSPTKTQSLS